MTTNITAGDPPRQMTPLYLGLLWKGPTWTGESTPQIRQDQRAHLALLDRLGKEGKLLLAGPIPEGDPLRGILICQASSIEGVRSYFEGDAHLKSGRLTLEILPWLAPTEALGRPLLAEAGG